MQVAEQQFNERFQKVSRSFRGGDEPPFRHQLSPTEEQRVVWDVLSGARDATPEELSHAWAVVQENLRTKQALRDVDRG